MSVKNAFENDIKLYHYAIIHPILQLIRIIAWKKDYTHQAIMLILIWTFVWFHTSLIAYTMPIWVTLIVYHYCIEETEMENEPHHTMEKLTDEIKEIQLELSLLLPSTESKDRLLRRSLYVLDQTYYYQAMLFTFIYSVWISLLNVFGGDKIIWFLGCIILTWNSPLLKVIRCHRTEFLFKQVNKKIINSTINPNTITPTNDHTDRFYRFVIIQHQRWWLHRGWTSMLLPNERPEWSDEYLSEVPSTALFHLPPPITKVDKITRKVTKTTWEWASPEWQIDENQHTGKDGWEYGNWDWDAWSTKSSGLSVLTRRKHWVRNARLVKEEIIDDTTTLPINIRKSSTCASISNSFSSQDSFLCTTPTASPISLYIKTCNFTTSTLSLNHSVEPTLISDRHSTVDNQLWLRR